MNWLRASVLVGLACMVMGSTGCAAPETKPREKRSSTTSTLTKPKPSIRTAASEATTDKYGITEWRLFRGAQDLFMTGYDADGEAVQGVSLAFNENDDGEAQLLTRVHDGSKFTAARSFATQGLTADAIPPQAAAFLQQVLGDLGGIGALFQNGGLDAAGIQLPDAAGACGADLAAVVQQAIQCTSEGTSKAAAAACVAAAKVAAQSATDCANVGAVDIADAENAGAEDEGAGDGDALAGIDLSQLGLPTGAGAGGFDVGAILTQIGGAAAGAGGDGANPFGGAGGLNLDGLFGGGLGQIFGNAQNGEPSFTNFTGALGF